MPMRSRSCDCPATAISSRRISADRPSGATLIAPESCSCNSVKANGADMWPRELNRLGRHRQVRETKSDARSKLGQAWFHRWTGFNPALVPGSHRNPQSRISSSSGRSASPLGVRRYARCFVPSGDGICSMILWRVSRTRRSLSRLVAIPSGDAVRSLNRDRPQSKSRMMSSVHRSPKISRPHEIGQGDRLASAGRRSFFFAMCALCQTFYLHSTSILL